MLTRCCFWFVFVRSGSGTSGASPSQTSSPAEAVEVARYGVAAVAGIAAAILA
jgi:hypothetical protein